MVFIAATAGAVTCVAFFLPCVHLLQLCKYRPSAVFCTDFYFGLYLSAVVRAAVCALVLLLFESLNLPLLASASVYVVFLASFLWQKKEKAKKPLVFTPRVKRLIALFFCISFAAAVLPYYAFGLNEGGFLAAIAAETALYPVFLASAAAILYPFELLNNNRKIRIAAQLLKEKNMIKIGITGSFGKTSVKEILYTVLSRKYKVLRTEGNFNTPAGISLTLEKMRGDEAVFIAEMGARKTGDIAFLARMVKPDYGIITGVAPQHLETFGTFEAVRKTKGELAAALPDYGTLIVNADEEQADLSGAVCKIVKVGKDGKYRVKGVRTDKNGSSFVFCTESEEEVFETVLLGRHNVQNIALAAALACELGLKPADIAKAVKSVKAPPHRLELTVTPDLTIIDDSYNANPSGVKCALEVLSEFDGIKTVITPGMVELGDEEEALNREYGKLIAEVADKVVLIGKYPAEYVYNGLSAAGYKGAVYRFPTLSEAEQNFGRVLSRGETVLFANDLPDNYK